MYHLKGDFPQFIYIEGVHICSVSHFSLLKFIPCYVQRLCMVSACGFRFMAAVVLLITGDKSEMEKGVKNCWQFSEKLY